VIWVYLFIGLDDERLTAEIFKQMNDKLG